MLRQVFHPNTIILMLLNSWGMLDNSKLYFNKYNKL